MDTKRETVHISDDKRHIVQIDGHIMRFQIDNHLGSSSIELDENANLISYEEYHPFGTTSYRAGRNAAEVSLKRYRYIGKERDEETGLYYYGFRYYDSSIARFINCDPIANDYLHVNPYNYAENMPISYIDLWGLQRAEPRSAMALWWLFCPDFAKSAINQDVKTVEYIPNLYREYKDGPEPSEKKIKKWFNERRNIIMATAVKYDIDPMYLGVILFRENQSFMAENNNWARFFIAKELAAAGKAILMEDYGGDMDRWSPGTAQMQLKLGIRIKEGMTVFEYNKWKKELLVTPNGLEEYKKKINSIINDLYDTEKAIDLLGKYIKLLLETYPNSTYEQTLEDFIRGPHKSRAEDKEENFQVKTDTQSAMKSFDIIENILYNSNEKKTPKK